MIAYKFLSAGAVGPFTGFSWPTDGSWVEAARSGEGSGIHGCRTGDLPYWLCEQLWRVELAGRIVERETQVEARRGRLLERVRGWDEAFAATFAAACAFRTRDLAAEVLRVAGRASQADALLAARDLATLAAAGRAASDLPPFEAEMVGYVVDASVRAIEGNAGSSSHTAAVAAVALRGSQAAFAAERAWQARWLSDRLDLER